MGVFKDLGQFLRTFAASSGFKDKVKSLGIARDAETDPAKAKQSVQTAIETAKIKHLTPKITILPDDVSCGNIETLCLRSVEDEDVYACVKQFFECVRGKNVTLPEGPAIHKHYAQVYMATKECPQMFPGMAAYKHVWPLTSEVFRSLRDFLSSL